ncbi:MAG: hypothetical protein AAGK37_23075 [Pseudomonadota bacterium]
MSFDGHGCCGRDPSDKETTVQEAGYDGVEEAILEIARYYWQTFAIPQSHSWLAALQRAESGVFADTNGEIGLEVLATVQAMRKSRVSCFRFNNPACPQCSSIVSEHERQFMNVFQAVRQGRIGAARTHAMLLCEGNPTDHLIIRMTALVEASVRPNEPRIQAAVPKQLV